VTWKSTIKTVFIWVTTHGVAATSTTVTAMSRATATTVQRWCAMFFERFMEGLFAVLRVRLRFYEFMEGESMDGIIVKMYRIEYWAKVMGF
jgi:hypothetical protein